MLKKVAEGGDTLEQMPQIVQASPVPVPSIPVVPGVLVDGLKPRGRWRKTLGDCLNHKDCGLMCCYAHVCCACCAYPSIKEEARVPSPAGWQGECCLLSGCADTALQSALLWMGCGFAGTYPILGVFGVFGTYPILGVTLFRMRRELVNLYSINEDENGSCCAVLCCTPCAVCQQSNEMFERADLVFDGCTTVRGWPLAPRVRRRDPEELVPLTTLAPVDASMQR